MLFRARETLFDQKCVCLIKHSEFDQSSYILSTEAVSHLTGGEFVFQKLSVSVVIVETKPLTLFLQC